MISEQHRSLFDHHSSTAISVWRMVASLADKARTFVAVVARAEAHRRCPRRAPEYELAHGVEGRGNTESAPEVVAARCGMLRRDCSVTGRALRWLRRAQMPPGRKLPAHPASSCAARCVDAKYPVAPGYRPPTLQRRRRRPPARDARPLPAPPAPVSPRAPTPTAGWRYGAPPRVDRMTIRPSATQWAAHRSSRRRSIPPGPPPWQPAGLEPSRRERPRPAREAP